MNNQEQPFYLKTGVIVCAFLFCWPIGVALLILRTNANKKNMFDRRTTEKMCYIIGGFLVLGGLGSFSGSFFAGVFYTAGGAALIYYGKKNKEKVERYKKYINLVVNNNVTSLDTIARKINVDYSVVRNDIQNLIDKGTFRNARIDDASRSLELSEVPSADLPQDNILGDFVDAITDVAREIGVPTGQKERTVDDIPQKPASNPNATIVAVTCPGCGATRRAIKGIVVECEYCGTIFNA